MTDVGIAEEPLRTVVVHGSPGSDPVFSDVAHLTVLPALESAVAVLPVDAAEGHGFILPDRLGQRASKPTGRSTGRRCAGDRGQRVALMELVRLDVELVDAAPLNLTSPHEQYRSLIASPRRFDAVGFRGRRVARREVVAADNKLKWATHDVDLVQTEICPDVERYAVASQQVETFARGLRHRDRLALIDQYRDDRIPRLVAQLDALDTWRRWAWATASTSSHSARPSTPSGPLAATVGLSAQVVQEWSGLAGIRLVSPEPPAPTPDHGLALEI